MNNLQKLDLLVKNKHLIKSFLLVQLLDGQPEKKDQSPLDQSLSQLFATIVARHAILFTDQSSVKSLTAKEESKLMEDVWRFLYSYYLHLKVAEHPNDKSALKRALSFWECNSSLLERLGDELKPKIIQLYEPEPGIINSLKSLFIKPKLKLNPEAQELNLDILEKLVSHVKGAVRLVKTQSEHGKFLEDLESLIEKVKTSSPSLYNERAEKPVPPVLRQPGHQKRKRSTRHSSSSSSSSGVFVVSKKPAHFVSQPATALASNESDISLISGDSSVTSIPSSSSLTS